MPPLKTYVTSSGFFDLAVAAPTMKAALDIWGAGPDLFRRGYAKETNDAAIVKATMAKPGTLLRRPVGGKGAFKEHAVLPDASTWEAPPPKKPLPTKAESSKPAPEPESGKPKAPLRPTAAEKAAEQKAARQYEAAQRKRKREAARGEAAEQKARLQRKRAVETAEASLRVARAAHDERVVKIEKARDKLERGAQEEEQRWQKQKGRLEDALRKARR